MKDVHAEEVLRGGLRAIAGILLTVDDVLRTYGCEWELRHTVAQNILREFEESRRHLNQILEEAREAMGVE